MGFTLPGIKYPFQRTLVDRHIRNLSSQELYQFHQQMGIQSTLVKLMTLYTKTTTKPPTIQTVF